MAKLRHKALARGSRCATPADCATCPARNIELFAGALRSEGVGLLEGFRAIQVASQDTLYRYGEAARHVFVLRNGLVKLERCSSTGDARIVRLARMGDTIGLEAVSRGTYRHTASALTATTLCQVPAEAIMNAEKTDGHFIARVLKEMQQEVDQADLFLTELSVGTAHARVARLFLYLAERDGGEECVMPQREDIGALVGVTMETASRIVSDFRHRKLIRTLASDAHRVAPDVAALEKVAAG